MVASPALPAVVAWSKVVLSVTLVWASAVPPPVHELNGDGVLVPLVVQLRVTLRLVAVRVVAVLRHPPERILLVAQLVVGGVGVVGNEVGRGVLGAGARAGAALASAGGVVPDVVQLTLVLVRCPEPS